MGGDGESGAPRKRNANMVLVALGKNCPGSCDTKVPHWEELMTKEQLFYPVNEGEHAPAESQVLLLDVDQ